MLSNFISIEKNDHRCINRYSMEMRTLPIVFNRNEYTYEMLKPVIKVIFMKSCIFNNFGQILEDHKYWPEEHQRSFRIIYLISILN